MQNKDSIPTPPSSSSSSSSSSLSSTKKRILFIRHGRTYMNEYLSQPGSRWGDAGFTDIGLPSQLYRDSPLSEKGIRQAQDLYYLIQQQKEEKEKKKEKERSEMGAEREEIEKIEKMIIPSVDEIDLVVLSPLTRSFQTFEYGLLPHLLLNDEQKQQLLKQQQQQNEGSQEQKPIIRPEHISIPVISLPLASERVYLMSDLGLSVEELKHKFPYVNYDTGFDHFDNNEWWFTVMKQDNKEMNKTHTFNSIHESKYKEWRPHKEGQQYSCYGEPDAEFNQRMMALYQWLDQCDESTICLVSHWGVLDYFTGMDFENCELKLIPFEDITMHLKSKSML